MRAVYNNLIPALWLIWLIGWMIAGWRTKSVIRAESIPSRLSHLIPLVLGIILLSFDHAGGHWLAMRIVPQTARTFWIGTALIVAGLGIACWARIHLAGNWSGMVTLKKDHSLTRTGPYRFTRHPIYTGLLIAILGSAIALAEWRGLVALLLITLAFLRKIAIEERFLVAQFGDDYLRYRQEVPALIPRLKR